MTDRQTDKVENWSWEKQAIIEACDRRSNCFNVIYIDVNGLGAKFPDLFIDINLCESKQINYTCIVSRREVIGNNNNKKIYIRTKLLL